MVLLKSFFLKNTCNVNTSTMFDSPKIWEKMYEKENINEK